MTTTSKPRLKWSRYAQHWVLIAKDSHGRWDYSLARQWRADLAAFNLSNGKHP